MQSKPLLNYSGTVGKELVVKSSYGCQTGLERQVHSSPPHIFKGRGKPSNIIWIVFFVRDKHGIPSLFALRSRALMLGLATHPHFISQPAQAFPIYLGRADLI